jgi:formylglycine-generating enzyme required for sulfatase activity
VTSFELDEFEVTTGRFRAWVDATNGDLRGHAPIAGAGAHPKIPNSGWRDEWKAALPATRDDVDRMLGPEECQVGADLDDYGALTWWTPALDAKVKRANAADAKVLAANTKEALDEKALSCVPWPVLFAFCIWDMGRLPTNAEWGYAAAGGSEQRQFPWGSLTGADVVPIGNHSNLTPAPRFSVGQQFVVAFLWDEDAGPNGFPAGYGYTWGSRFGGPHDNALHMAPVGRRVAGRGRWGHADLAGGVYEWMLDEGPIRPGPCVDCANVSWPAPSARDPALPVPFPLPDFEDRWFGGGARAIRGGAWDNALGLSNVQTASEIETYTSYPLSRTYRSLGGRCAHDLPAQ